MANTAEKLLTKVYELQVDGFLETNALPDIQEQVDELLQVGPISAQKITREESEVPPAARSTETRRIYLDFHGDMINDMELKEILEQGYQERLELTDPASLREFLVANASAELLRKLAIVSADSAADLADLQLKKSGRGVAETHSLGQKFLQTVDRFKEKLGL